jgi:hypothetical protein
MPWQPPDRPVTLPTHLAFDPLRRIRDGASVFESYHEPVP